MYSVNLLVQHVVQYNKYLAQLIVLVQHRAGQQLANTTSRDGGMYVSGSNLKQGKGEGFRDYPGA